VIVSDFGEEPVLHQEGTGKGAKVFAIEVLPDGSAGATRILHEGLPLRSPQGVTVVGSTVVVADAGAGEPAKRFDAPDIEYLSGAIFKIPLAGGEPTRVFRDHTFVTVVGLCRFKIGEDWYLRIWDIDGGPHDTSPTAWMPHSGLTAPLRAKVQSFDPLTFGPIQPIQIMEEFPVTLQLKDISPNKTVILRGVEGTSFGDGHEIFALPSSSNVKKVTSIMTSSPIQRNTLKFDILVTDTETGNVDEDTPHEIIKSMQARPMMDNKHGATRTLLGENTHVTDWLEDATVDGVSRTLTLFPLTGGVPGIIWQGEPFGTPMGTQFSWDAKELWVTDASGGPDGTGAIWRVALPTSAEAALMFSPGNAWKLNEELLPR
jgi:hypothetical protein